MKELFTVEFNLNEKDTVTLLVWCIENVPGWKTKASRKKLFFSEYLYLNKALTNALLAYYYEMNIYRPFIHKAVFKFQTRDQALLFKLTYAGIIDGNI